MKSKTFLILVIACCVLGVAAYLSMNSEESASKGKMGKALLPDLVVDNIAAISIKGHENSLRLTKGENVWGVESSFAYPADFPKINDLVQKLRDTKIGRNFGADPDTLNRLALHRPDKKEIPEDHKGTRLILEDSQKKVMADILLGKSRDTGGHYVMLAGSPDVYMVDQIFRFLDKKPGDWLDKKLLEVNSGDVEKVICRDLKNDKILYTLARPEKGKEPEFENLPEGKKIVKNKADSLLGGLSSFSIDNVADPAKKAEETGLDSSLCFEYHLFDGTVYKAYPGNQLADDESFYFKARVSYVAPEIKTEAETEADGDDKEKADQAQAKAEEEKAKQEKLSADAKKLDDKITPWLYVISKWKHEKFVSDAGQLLEDDETKKAEADTQKPDTGDEAAAPGKPDNQKPAIGTIQPVAPADTEAEKEALPSKLQPPDNQKPAIGVQQAAPDAGKDDTAEANTESADTDDKAETQ